MWFKRFLNGSEEAVYQRLLVACERRPVRVHCKPRIADVLPIQRSGISNELFGFALKSHFDFLLIGPDGRALIAIEFDGPTHLDPVVVERNAKKDALCNWFGFALVRIRDEHIGGLTAWLGDCLDRAGLPASRKPIPEDMPPDPPPQPRRRDRDQPRSLPPKRDSMPIALGVLAGLIGLCVLALVLVVIVVVAGRPSPAPAAVSDRPPKVIGTNTGVPRPTTGAAIPPSGPTATGPQMGLLGAIVRRKGWTEERRDSEAERVLGFRRPWDSLSKREASKLIDAWDDRKK
jgi:hypothetical protein